MYRKILLIIALLVGGSVAFAPTQASARRGGRGWGGRGFGWGGAAIGLGLELGLAAGYPAYGYGYPAYGYPAYGGCWRRGVVHTPYGPRYRRVWVCD